MTSPPLTPSRRVREPYVAMTTAYPLPANAALDNNATYFEFQVEKPVAQIPGTGAPQLRQAGAPLTAPASAIPMRPDTVPSRYPGNDPGSRG